MTLSPEPMDRRMADDSATIADVAKRLVALVHAKEPVVVTRPTEYEGIWREMVGPALLKKSAGTLHSMMLLLPEKHLADPLILLRALYETVVVFSWIAIDPEVRVERWHGSCHEVELRNHHDWEQAGRPVLSPEEVRIEEETARQIRKRLDLDQTDDRGKYSQPLVPSVQVMATDCDKHWGGVVVGWSSESRVGDVGDVTGWHSSLRGLYRWVYRMGSMAVHSQHRGLDPFVTTDETRLMVHSENRVDSLMHFGLACYLLGLEIGVAERALGWPDYSEAARILGRYDSLFSSLTREDREAISPAGG